MNDATLAARCNAALASLSPCPDVTMGRDASWKTGPGWTREGREAAVKAIKAVAASLREEARTVEGRRIGKGAWAMRVECAAGRLPWV